MAFEDGLATVGFTIDVSVLENTDYETKVKYRGRHGTSRLHGLTTLTKDLPNVSWEDTL